MNRRRPSPLVRAVRRRGPVVAVAGMLALGSGGGLLAASIGGGPAAADTTLGGFTLSSLAEGVTVQYEQPNLPIPATPSVEADAGYASTTDNYGPTGTATAATVYPGQVLANLGTQTSLILPGAPIPPLPAWPIQAISEYPQTPNTASTDQPGVSMDTVSSDSGQTATATLGDDAPNAGSTGTQTSGTTTSAGGNALAASSSLAGIGAISATSSSGAPSTTATASATATVSGISILGGFITIGAVTSTATANSDGNTGTVTGSTEIANASIAGEAVTIDSSGIHVAGKGGGAVPVATLNKLLNELGITLTVTNAIDTVQAASATRELDGLRLDINLDTLDKIVNKIGSLLPASVTDKLPVPLPNEQEITIDFGTVTVSSSASPSFSGDTSSDTGSTTDTSGAVPSGTFTSPTTTGTGSDFTGTVGGTPFSSGTTPSTGATTTSPTTSTGSTTPVVAPTSAVTPVFKGIGSGLVLLGVLAALALAYTYKRVDDVSEFVGPACAGGDSMRRRFLDGPEGDIDEGDFEL
ncbi:MAG TPA: choice-of-anchor P family protein [Acidimicrobiales bacterium]|nr:choice-of-anchor P family protein [Acidimicrobiales bacterium]